MTPSERAALIAEMTNEELRRWSLHVFAQLAPERFRHPTSIGFAEAVLRNYDAELQEIFNERT